MKKNIFLTFLLLTIIWGFSLFFFETFATENTTLQQKDKDIKSTEVSDDEKKEDFKASVNANGNWINVFLLDDIYYLFLPKGIDLKKVNIYYTYSKEILNTSSGTNNLEEKIITNDFSKIDTLNITFKDNKQYTIKVMQSDIPSIFINLSDDITLETIKKEIKALNIKGIP